MEPGRELAVNALKLVDLETEANITSAASTLRRTAKRVAISSAWVNPTQNMFQVRGRTDGHLARTLVSKSFLLFRKFEEQGRTSAVVSHETTS